MNRDMDLVRSLLLELESYPFLPDQTTLEEIDVKPLAEKLGVSDDHIHHHLRLMYQAGFIEAWVFRGKLGVSQSTKRQVDHDYIFFVTPKSITWKGYEYLETVRDPELWKKTKEGAKKIGSFGFDTIMDLAKGLIKEKIKHHTGVEIEM